MGWTLKQWMALDEDEQLDWLARDYKRQERLRGYLAQMHALIEDDKPVDPAAYMQLLVEVN